MNEELEAIIREIDRTPLGPDELQLIQEGIDLAIEYQAAEYEYRLRLRLLASLNHIGNYADVIENFVWCLEKHNNNPSQFPLNPDPNIADLSWIYGWVISILAHNNSIALSELLDKIKDYQDFYRQNQLPRAHPYTVLAKIYSNIGDLKKVEFYLNELELLDLKADPDYCESCHIGIRSYYLKKTGDIDNAIELVESNYGEKSCNVEPWGSMCTLLFEIAQRDTIKATRYYHAIAKKFTKPSGSQIKITSYLAIFCVLTGNNDSALKIVEYNAEYLDKFSSIDHDDQFWFFFSSWLLCKALIAAGRGESLTLNFRSSNILKLHISYLGYGCPQDLVEAFKTSTLATAEKFDERNQNSRYADFIEYFQNLDLPKIDLDSETVAALEKPLNIPVTADEWRIRWALLVALRDFTAAAKCQNNFIFSDIDRIIFQNLQSQELLGSLPNIEKWNSLRKELAELLQSYCEYLDFDNPLESEANGFLLTNPDKNRNYANNTMELETCHTRFTEIFSAYETEPLLWFSTLKASLVDLLKKNPPHLVMNALKEIVNDTSMAQESNAIFLYLCSEHFSNDTDQSLVKTTAKSLLSLARSLNALTFEEILLRKFLFWAKNHQELRFALELAKSLVLISRERSDNLEFQLELADISVALSDFDTAIEYYRKAYAQSIAPSPLFTKSLWNFATALAQTRRISDAEELLANYLKHYEYYKGSTEYHNYLIKLVDFFEHYARRNVSRKYAELNYREISMLQTTPENAKIKAKAYYQLGILYHHDKDNKEWQIIDSALSLDYLSIFDRLDIYENVFELLLSENRILPMIRVLNNAAKLAYTHGLTYEVKDRYIDYKMKLAKLYAKKSLSTQYKDKSDLPNCIHQLLQLINLNMETKIRKEIYEYLAQAYEAYGDVQEAEKWQASAKTLVNPGEEHI